MLDFQVFLCYNGKIMAFGVSKEVSVDMLFNEAELLMRIGDPQVVTLNQGEISEAAANHLEEFAHDLGWHHRGYPIGKAIMEGTSELDIHTNVHFRYRRLLSRGAEFILSTYDRGPIHGVQLAFNDDLEFPDLPRVSFLQTNHNLIPGNVSRVLVRPKPELFSPEDRRELHERIIAEQRHLRSRGYTAK